MFPRQSTSLTDRATAPEFRWRDVTHLAMLFSFRLSRSSEAALAAVTAFCDRSWFGLAVFPAMTMTEAIGIVRGPGGNLPNAPIRPVNSGRGINLN